MKSRSLDELLHELNLAGAPYEDQYKAITSLCADGLLRPVRSSPPNGKKPALHSRYVRLPKKSGESRDEEAALFAELEGLAPEIARIYYRMHPESYRKEREYVLLLNSFFLQKKHLLTESVSCNERSFQIWHDEKFLKKRAKRLLAHCGVDYASLNVYETAEPFASFSVSRETPQNILVIENSDTFYSMRRALLRAPTLFGRTIGTLIYGAGSRILSSFGDFVRTADPFLQQEENTFLYWGDLDYQGISIFVQVMNDLSAPVSPFSEAYLTMLEKARHITLRNAKPGQRKLEPERFFGFFEPEARRCMEEILRKGLYIPQEIVTIHDVLPATGGA
ncbi:MAG: DUF2220 domain-containing protein [Desulfovibrio sp.]|nr:DUF2220 domain-containing protein [Desulfovibrio sp.]